MSDKPRYYDVMDWPEINPLVQDVYEKIDDEAYLQEKEFFLAGAIVDGIAAIEILDHQILNAEDSGSLSKEDEAKLEKRRFALIHLRARTRRLIGLHGSIRSALGTDPVFTVSMNGT